MPAEADADGRPQAPGSGTPGEVFGAFLKLGVTSFGGPIAHLGYLHREFVQRRGWLDEAHYAHLLAVCQFLPGPASSQLGFALGLLRAGWRGALAAFIAFTLPSALLMFGFAALAPFLGHGLGAAAVHGLKLVAVVVVAHGLVGMLQRLTPDAVRASIAAGATALVAITGNPWMQLLAIALGGLAGRWWCRHLALPDRADFTLPYGMRLAGAFLMLYLAGLAGALWMGAAATPTPQALAAAFYKAGALVFGGGHVVLPLLKQAVVDTGWLRPDAFLAGYGAAQAVPGPMFSLAAYLGAQVPLMWPPAAGAALALLALFLPGFLLLLAALPAWSRVAQHPAAAGAMAGINAAVVGLLLAAFYDPVWREGVRNGIDFSIAVVGFVLLAAVRLPVGWLLLWCVAASLIAASVLP
ncbi:chromate efflux transporter [Aerosticca soli]|nr:chromate efflux transporter [Aerosticca soli]